MDLRITPQALVSQTVANLQQNENQLANLQEQASTGERMLQPSDDPAAAVQVLAANAQNLQLGAYLNNIKSSQATLNASSSALQQASTLLTQAIAAATTGATANNTPTTLGTLATQVNAIIGQVVGLANTRDPSGRYVFGGTATGAAPYVVSADAQGRPISVAYVGSGEASDTTVSLQQSVRTAYAGDQVFQSAQRGTTVFTGPTGAAAGTGTDSAVGQGTLLVSHTTTTYAPGSGVQTGTDSLAGDTILGPAGAHTLTVNDTSGNGSAGTVSLDGGPAIAFTNADADLKVSGPNGQVAYLNTTAITAGFNGTVAITANGTLSTDGGASSTAIDFSANQVVKNQTTGAVTNVNSSNIRGAGSDRLTYPGTTDVFQTLIALRDALNNTAGLSGADQQAAVSAQITELKRVQGGILQAAGEQGAGLQTLSTVQTRIQGVQLNLQSALSDLQGADVSQVAIGLQAQQNQLQLTLASASRIFSQSLLDFLK
jgi:flagellar hook-associated protein 3 FlgL